MTDDQDEIAEARPDLVPEWEFAAERRESREAAEDQVEELARSLRTPRHDRGRKRRSYS